ncbi:uncharacterized protein PV09_03252 [Verruconis gallopava]|uniref:VOC domain-containing protein n=1 Tax=Verruconis gallopava TaxID=253628 RepID=A0A0D1XTM0_9PEZI|nr:uncharacterized protein PV09_03252 [Verruconis gallopava]KIW06081.1 hypothetical protein PV09_03252 [Verruconis gallopava]
MSLFAPQFDEMVLFYKTFLGAEASYENDYLCSLRYEEEHHRITIGKDLGTKPKVPTTSGLEHIAFAYSTLKDLVLSYKQQQRFSIEPFRCVNHGPTTSMYYRDREGTRVAIRVDNFDTPEEAI